MKRLNFYPAFFRKPIFLLFPLLMLSTSLLAQKEEGQVYKQYSTGRFVEIRRPFQTGDYAVGIQAKGKLANVVTNFGQLSSFHIFAPAFEWPAFGEDQDDEQQYGWGVDLMMGINGEVIESFQDPASNIISRDWQPAEENLFSGSVTVSESDLTPVMATSDNSDTWPIGPGGPFWPGLFRRDTSGTVFPGQFTSERDHYCVYTDAGNATPYGLRVEQTSYSFARRYAEDFLVYRFNIKNTSGDSLIDLYPGMMVQFLIDFDNHDLINFIDSNGDGQRDFIYMWDENHQAQEPWSKVGYIGLLAVTTPFDRGITNFHFFHDDFTPSKDNDFWTLLTSDTTGIPDTTRIKFFHGNDFRIDDVALAPALDPEGNNRGGEITWSFSSGPVSLAAGDSMQLEIAVICGDDEQDLLANADWVWFLAGNGWNGSNPPESPKVEVFGGDGRVTVVWDAGRAENSRDNINGSRDFEGYKVYRSADRGKSWGREITNSRGEFIGYVPLAQFDLDNDVSGNDPISGQYLGRNSGLQHTFIDTTVVNGVEYWYTVSAYDRGDSLNQVESLESALGLTTDEVNVASVIPAAPPANYSPGELLTGEVNLQPDSGFTDAHASIEVIDPAALKDRRYQVNFREDTPIGNGDTVTTFTLSDAETGEVLLKDHPLTDASGDNLPVVDGFRLKLEDVESGQITLGWTKVAQDTCTFYWDVQTIGPNDPVIVYTRDDFRIVVDTTAGGGLSARYYDLWAEEPTDSSTHLPIKIYQVTDPENPIDVSANTFLGEFITSPFGIFSPPGWDLVPGGAGYAPMFPYPDRIIMEYIDSNGDTSGLRLVTQNGPPDATPPSQGDEFTIRVSRGFAENVVYTFATRGPQFTSAEKAQLEAVRVVPNPFFVSSAFDNQILFTHLPVPCDISIYNVAGDLIRQLRHEGPGGTARWDLKNGAGLAVAYGLYVYVVKTETGDTRVGKFSIIR